MILHNERSSSEGKQVSLHNKLVRDRIPEIIEEQGVTVKTEVVEDKVRLIRLLLDKLEEEAQAATLADDEHLLEELGDIESVIDGILKLTGISRQQLKDQQDSKDTVRGGFEKGIFLIETIEKDVDSESLEDSESEEDNG